MNKPPSLQDAKVTKPASKNLINQKFKRKKHKEHQSFMISTTSERTISARKKAEMSKPGFLYKYTERRQSITTKEAQEEFLAAKKKSNEAAQSTDCTDVPWD